jgi:hypothetical protein
MMLMAISVAGTEEEIEAYAERVASGYRPPIADNFPLELRWGWGGGRGKRRPRRVDRRACVVKEGCRGSTSNV